MSSLKIAENMELNGEATKSSSLDIWQYRDNSSNNRRGSHIRSTKRHQSPNRDVSNETPHQMHPNKRFKKSTDDNKPLIICSNLTTNYRSTEVNKLNESFNSSMDASFSSSDSDSWSSSDSEVSRDDFDVYDLFESDDESDSESEGRFKDHTRKCERNINKSSISYLAVGKSSMSKDIFRDLDEIEINFKESLSLSKSKSF